MLVRLGSGAQEVLAEAQGAVLPRWSRNLDSLRWPVHCGWHWPHRPRGLGSGPMTGKRGALMVVPLHHQADSMPMARVAGCPLAVLTIAPVSRQPRRMAGARLWARARQSSLIIWSAAMSYLSHDAGCGKSSPSQSVMTC